MHMTAMIPQVRGLISYYQNGNPSHTDHALRGFHMTIPASHFSQLITWPTNPLKLHGRPTSPADETRLQYLVQVSIGPSMPNLEVLNLERSRPTLRSWFHSCQTYMQPNPTGRIATWSRFISKAAEKTLPFFKVLRKTKNFDWDASYQQAFEELKKYLAGLPLLVKPAQGHILYLYLSVTPKAIGSVLVREEEGKQMPIYYVNKVLNGAKGRYAPIKKIALALVGTTRRLRPYFLTSCQSQDKSNIEANVGKTRYFRKFGEISRGIKRIRPSHTYHEQ
ncbi:UNVERIFIED_CONTAM: hypothetical protein Sradi_0880000 [Sesamum radiatum]|uniref:Reverse transcriptase/retrotransposon-derived protein RNase H-like domain-containing protein n=1 Tax=Sesamum radiatum TaxID=300843 RepID=A0AAW2V4W3_SESRA